jgi:hypothetical protein
MLLNVLQSKVALGIQPPTNVLNKLLSPVLRSVVVVYWGLVQVAKLQIVLSVVLPVKCAVWADLLQPLVPAAAVLAPLAHNVELVRPQSVASQAVELVSAVNLNLLVNSVKHKVVPVLLVALVAQD